MKKTQEIIGLPIISISDGQEVGKVKSIIINADRGTIDYVVVDSGIQILSARIISTESVLGIGEYAMTIENEGVVNDISKIPAAIDLLKKNIEIKGTKVLTRKGRLIGEIGDFYIDENTFKIVGLEYIADITQKRVRIIPRESVITLGKNLIVVVDEVEDALVDRINQLGTEYDSGGKDGGYGQVNSYANMILQDLQESSTVNEPAEGQQPAEKSGELDNAAALFEQKQRQYLKNRYATKTIADNNGTIVVNEGEKITDEIIDAAKLCGKLIELVMNNRA